MKNNIENILTPQFKRDELLAIIANNLELDNTRKEKMRTAYNAVNEVLKADPYFFEGIKVEVYEQGSLRIGTTIKPLPGKNFDLDVVLHIYDSFLNHTPAEIYDELFRVLSNHDTYQPLLERKKRCIRINYKSDFHMDILPGCMITIDNTRLKIAKDEKRLTWSRTNPEGYGEWFDGISQRKQAFFLLENAMNSFVKAQVETRELPLEVYAKTPLQRTVQIIKRYRDLFYSEKNEDSHPPVSSVVLTTMVAQGYEDEVSIQDALLNAVKRLKKKADDYRYKGIKFKVENPVDNHADIAERENFVDFWNDRNYESFAIFVDQLLKDLNVFFNQPLSKTTFEKLFGSGYYNEAVQQQIKYDSIIKGDIRPAALLSGAALTDRFGNINQTSGSHNGSHGFYAE